MFRTSTNTANHSSRSDLNDRAADEGRIRRTRSSFASRLSDVGRLGHHGEVQPRRISEHYHFGKESRQAPGFRARSVGDAQDRVDDLLAGALNLSEQQSPALDRQEAPTG